MADDTNPEPKAEQEEDPDYKNLPKVDFIWKKRKEESPGQYEKFLVYLKLGPRRSLTQAYQKGRPSGPNPNTVMPGQLCVLARHMEWRERAAAYDEYVREIEFDELEQCRRAWVQQQFKLAQKMCQKAEQMLMATPGFTKRTMTMPDGSTSTVYIPDGWSFLDAMKLLKEASELGREALGLETRPDVVIENRTEPNKIDKAREMLAEADKDWPEPTSTSAALDAAEEAET
jgi:hypothetical protein